MNSFNFWILTNPETIVWTNSSSFSRYSFLFNSFKVINKFNKFSLFRINGPSFWNKLIIYLNTHLKLKKTIEGVEFNILMILLTFINCILIIVALFLTDNDTLEIFEIIDKIFFGIYVSEFILKVN